MGGIVGQGRAGGVQTQVVTHERTQHRAGEGGAGSACATVIDFGQCPANGRGRVDGPGRDGAGHTRNRGRGVLVVAHFTAGIRRSDGEAGRTRCSNGRGLCDVAAVVVEGNALRVQVEGITGDGATHRCGQRGVFRQQRPVVDLGVAAHDGGCGRQGFGRDGRHGVVDHRLREAVVTAGAVGCAVGDGESTGARRDDGVGRGCMGRVVVQAHIGDIEVHAVACNRPLHRSGQGGAGGGRIAIVGLAQRATNCGRRCQGPGGDAGIDVGDCRRREAVVRGHAAGRGRADCQRAGAAGDDGIGADHVGAVVGQVHTRGVQGQRVTRHSAIHRAADRGTRCCGAAVIDLGECAANAGCGAQGLGGDGAGDIGNDRGGEAVVAGHTVAGGRGNGECAAAQGRDLVGQGGVGIVVDQGDARGVQAQRVAIHCTVHHACHRGARGRRGPVIDLGECAANAGRGGQGLGGDGGGCTRDGGRREVVVAGQAARRGGVDGQRGVAGGGQRGSGGDVGIVIGDAQGRRIQGHRVASNGACDGSTDRGRRSRRAIVALGQCAADAGRCRQGFGRDGGGRIRNCGCAEVVVTHQAAGTGRDDRQRAAACGHDGVGRDHVCIVVGQGDTRGVQAQAVASHGTGYRAGDGGAGGGGGAVVGLGEAAPDAGRGCQRFGGDGRGGVCDHRGREAVVRHHAVGGGGADGQCATAARADLVGARHVGIVVGQADARGVEAQGVAGNRAGDVARHGGAGGRRGAVIHLGQRAANAGRDGQGFGADRAGHVGNRRCCVAVITGHTVGTAGGGDRESPVADGGDAAGPHDVCVVVGERDAGAVQVQGVAGDGAGHRAGQGRAGGGGGAVIRLVQGPANGGGRRQGSRRDRGRCIGDGGRTEAVVTGQTVGGGRGDGQR